MGMDSANIFECDHPASESSSYHYILWRRIRRKALKAVSQMMCREERMEVESMNLMNWYVRPVV